MTLRTLRPILLAAVLTSAFGAAAALNPGSAAATISAGTNNGTLNVTGNGDNDHVRLRIAPGDPGTLQLDADGDLDYDADFPRGAFSKIVVDLGSGDDSVLLDTSNGVFSNTEETTLFGGGLLAARGPRSERARLGDNAPRTHEEAEMTTETHDGTALADELLKRIGQTVGDKAKVSTVFGEPVERAGITVIPVAKARFGFGGGGGAGTRGGEEGSGGGGGGGGLVSPVGYIELREGTAQFKRISSPTDALALVAAAALAALAVKRLLAG